MANKDLAKAGKKTQFKKGTSGNPDGRPRKWVSTLTEIGYKKAEINDALMALMAMDLTELKEAEENPTATILEKTIATAMLTDIDRGQTTTIDKLIERVHGRAKQEISQHITGNPTAMEITIVKNEPDE